MPQCAETKVWLDCNLTTSRKQFQNGSKETGRGVANKRIQETTQRKNENTNFLYLKAFEYKSLLLF